MRDVSCRWCGRDVRQGSCGSNVLGIAGGEEDFGGAGEVGLVPVQELDAFGGVGWGGDVLVDYEDHVVDCAGGVFGTDDRGFVEDVCRWSVNVCHE